MENHTRPSITHPPRHIPLRLAISLLFENVFSLFGLFFFSFGMIFVWIFGMNADYSSFIDFSGTLETAYGHVTGYEKTRFSEGGSDSSPGTPVYETSFIFTDANGQRHELNSFACGSYHEEGERVEVEFPPGKPHKARIKGMRRAPVGLFAGFVFIFPLVGAVMLVAGLRKGRKKLYLLSAGFPAEAVITDMQPTNVQVNHQTVMQIRFRFEAADGNEYESEYKTHNVYRIGDEKTELVLYDPLDPEYAVPYDGIGSKPLFDAGGNVICPGAATGITALLLLAASIAGHGWYIVYLITH